MKRLIILFIIIGLTACSGGKAPVGDNVVKQPPSQIEKWISNRTIDFQANWAIPQIGTQRNLIDTPNFFRIKKDSVLAELPFYGRKFSGYNPSEGGISIKSIMKDINWKRNENNGTIALEFDADGIDMEGYQIIMKIFENRNATIIVNSNRRDQMTYRGRIQELEVNKNE